MLRFCQHPHKIGLDLGSWVLSSSQLRRSRESVLQRPFLLGGCFYRLIVAGGWQREPPIGALIPPWYVQQSLFLCEIWLQVLGPWLLVLLL